MKFGRNSKQTYPICKCGATKLRKYISWQSNEYLSRFQIVDDNKIYLCPFCDKKYIKPKKSDEIQVPCIMCGKKIMADNKRSTCDNCKNSDYYKNPDWVAMM